MTTNKMQSEPSMEDLLASIREIIADDVRQIKSDNTHVRSAAQSKEGGRDSAKSSDKSKSSTKASMDNDIVLELTQKVDAHGGVRMGAQEERVRTRVRAETTFDPEQLDEGRDLNPNFSTADSRGLLSKNQNPQANLKQGTGADFDFLDPRTVQDATKALEGLSSIVISDVEGNAHQSGTVGTKTVEELMKELLRPLLKTWLDAHLPSLVKWVVAEQVEKILQSRHHNN